jgi:hypothetical protein
MRKFKIKYKRFDSCGRFILHTIVMNGLTETGVRLRLIKMELNQNYRIEILEIEEFK